MSLTLVQDVLDEAAVRFGDPSKTHFDNSALLSFYNDACEDISTRWAMLEIDAAFPWIANEDRYSYPNDCVLMFRLQYNPSAVDAVTPPTDQTLWKKVDQAFEEEYEDLTNGNKPPGDDKLRYWGRASFFVVYPVPIKSLFAAGLIGYWKQAYRQVTATTPAPTIELPDPMRRLIRDRMLIGMKQSLSRTSEANNDLQIWERSMDDVATRIERGIDDRRQRIRPGRPTDWANAV